MKQTIRQQLIAVIEAMGEKVVFGKSGRYVVYTRVAGGYYYIGSHGALRIGKSILGSLSWDAKRFIQLHINGSKISYTGVKSVDN